MSIFGRLADWIADRAELGQPAYEYVFPYSCYTGSVDPFTAEEWDAIAAAMPEDFGGAVVSGTEETG
jgi:hypothetical protein